MPATETLELTDVMPEVTEDGKQFNPYLHAQCRETVKKLGLTNAEFAKQLGVSETETSKYLNKKPAGNVTKTEALIVDWLTQVEMGRRAPHVAGNWVETQTAETVSAALDTILETQDFGVVVGPAGCGKTEMARRYQEQHPTSILCTVTKDQSSNAGVERLLLRQLRTRGVSQYDTKWEFLRVKLTGSHRLLIFDGAHKLRESGLECLFDLHDHTGVPICLIGNATMITHIRGRTAHQIEANEQHTSRVGFKCVMKPRFTKAEVRQLIGLHMPKFSDDLLKHAVKIANGPGHLRALRKHLLLVQRLTLVGMDDAQAIVSAHDMLLTDLSLTADE